MKQPPAYRLICCCCPWPGNNNPTPAERDAERALPELDRGFPHDNTDLENPHKDDDIVPFQQQHEVGGDEIPRKPEPVAELESPVKERHGRGRPQHGERTTSESSSQANNAINTALRFPSPPPPRRSVETQETLDERDDERDEGERGAPPPSYERAMAEK